MLDKNAKVAYSVCDEYDEDRIYEILKEQMKRLGIGKTVFAGKNVVFKPNLVRKAKPEEAVTTHPSVVAAAVRAVKDFSPSSLTIAESPGGAYMESTLKAQYTATGIKDSAEKHGCKLNYDTSFSHVEYPQGVRVKGLEIINPVLNADVIVNLCKIKTHAYTAYSGAVKNYFGTVPGLRKFEMHSRFSDSSCFHQMLCDLCLFHHSRLQCLNIADAIVGMEGNGPTNGIPRKFNSIFMSENAFNLDIAATHMLGINDVFMLEDAKKRSLCASSFEELEVVGDNILENIQKKLVLPDSKRKSGVKLITEICGGRINRIFEPLPYINKKKCVGCGECVRSCPEGTIGIASKSKKKIAHIDHVKCIKCYCCQELCPYDAVKIRKNILFVLFK